MEWVRQIDDWGCTLAALAMVLGRTYEDVKTEILTQHPERDFSKCGLNYIDADQLLTARGYATARIYSYYVDRPREIWPPAPFGELHLCQVRCTSNSPGHTVVMLSDGTVMDPLTPEPRKLVDYYEVHHVAAVVTMYHSNTQTLAEIKSREDQ